MNRDDAYALMVQHTPSPSLQRHMLNVETAMRWYARKFGENEELYAITGLLHDFDYEQHPYDPETGTGHPFWGVAYLREHTALPEEVLTAILGHATYSGVPRESLLARTLFAVDELTGLVQAAALIRPDKDVRMIELPSLQKKFRTKNFAAGVNREEVELGASELGLSLEEHMRNVLTAMQEAPVDTARPG